MKARILLFTTLVFIIKVAALPAQFKNSEFGVGVLVGGSKLRGDIENTNMGFTGGIMLRYSLNPSIAITATGTYGQMTSGLDAIKTNIFSAALLGTYYFIPENYFRPFLSLGLTRFHYSTKDGNGEQLFGNDSSPIKAWKSSLQFGIGFELFTSKRWAINTMGNYNITLVDDLDAIGGGAKDGFFHGFIGLVHYFKSSKNVGKNAFLPNTGLTDKAVVEELPSIPETQPDLSEDKASEQFANGIHFERGTANLLVKSKKQLHEIYRYLASHPNEVLELLGVTGANRKETQLVAERAKAVKAYLVNLGIAADRIIVKSQISN